MRLASIWKLAKESVSAWSDDYAPSMGAAIAYYTVFSIAPLLVIAIGVAGLVFGEDAARGAIFEQLRGLVGDEGATAVQGLVESASKPGRGAVATVVGLVTLAIGATTVFGELQSDLDRIWRAPVQKSSGLWGLIRARILSFGLVLAVGFLLLVSLVVSAALAALGSWWGGMFGDTEWLLQVLNFVVSFAVITTLFALIYKLLPRVSIDWQDVWVGAGVTALLFSIGKVLIGIYLGKAGVVSGFGAAGSLVVVLVWVYYSAQIFLLGAEFTWVYAYRFGSRRGQEMPRARGEETPGQAASGPKAPAAAPAHAPLPSPAAATAALTAHARAARDAERLAAAAERDDAAIGDRPPTSAGASRALASVRKALPRLTLASLAGVVLALIFDHRRRRPRLRTGH